MIKQSWKHVFMYFSLDVSSVSQNQLLNEIISSHAIHYSGNDDSNVKDSDNDDDYYDDIVIYLLEEL